MFSVDDIQLDSSANRFYQQIGFTKILDNVFTPRNKDFDSFPEKVEKNIHLNKIHSKLR